MSLYKIALPFQIVYKYVIYIYIYTIIVLLTDADEQHLLT